MNQEAELFVHAVYSDEASAAAAVTALMDARFPPDKIGALLRAGDQVDEVGVEHKTGVAAGAALGAVLGAVGGVIASAGGLLIVGPAFLAVQAVAGGALGTLAGTLGGLGLWHDQIDFPAESFARGAVIVGVSTHTGQVDEARAVLRKAGADQVYVSSKAAARVEPRSAHPPHA